jgi:hypothetical protein
MARNEKYVENDYDEIGLIFINDKETLELFQSLVAEVQGKIIQEGLRKAVKPILVQAKMNLNAIKKNKSKTGYAYIEKSIRARAAANKRWNEINANGDAKALQKHSICNASKVKQSKTFHK